MQSQNRTLLIVLIVAAVVICCWCAIMGGVGAVLVGLPIRSARTEPQVMITRVVTRVATPAQAARASVTPVASTQAPAPQALATQAPATPASPAAGTPRAGATSGAPDPSSQAQATGAQPALDPETEMLKASEMPAADPRLLAMQLQANTGQIPEVVTDTAPVYKVGDRKQFWVSNNDTQEHKAVTAELKYLTDVVAVWVEAGRPAESGRPGDFRQTLL